MKLSAIVLSFVIGIAFASPATPASQNQEKKAADAKEARYREVYRRNGTDAGSAMAEVGMKLRDLLKLRIENGLNVVPSGQSVENYIDERRRAIGMSKIPASPSSTPIALHRAAPRASPRRTATPPLAVPRKSESLS